MYKKNKQYDEAIKIYQNLLKDTPNDINVFMNLGNALTEKGETDKAIGYFKTVLDQKDDFALAHHNIGIAYRNKNLIELAISHFKKISIFYQIIQMQ